MSARVLFDGTNGNFVNTSTHLRDQERAPVAADLKRLMREKAKTGEVTFGLTADVKEAHRQVPIHPDDWHLLGCQLEHGGEVFVNTVGTFGVSSASYYWSRVSTAVGRLTQYFISQYATTWIMLFADDYHVEVGGQHFRPALLVFFLLCEVFGCPLSWNKTNGGTVTNWVGFELLLKEHALGLTERRAAWVVKWGTRDSFSSSGPRPRVRRSTGEDGLRHQCSGTPSSFPVSALCFRVFWTEGFRSTCPRVRIVLSEVHCKVS